METSGDHWCCYQCRKLLGVRKKGRLYIRLARGQEYIVTLPAVAHCRRCGALNEVSAETEAQRQSDNTV